MCRYGTNQWTNIDFKKVIYLVQLFTIEKWNEKGVWTTPLRLRTSKDILIWKCGWVGTCAHMYVGGQVMQWAMNNRVSNFTLQSPCPLSFRLVQTLFQYVLQWEGKIIKVLVFHLFKTMHHTAWLFNEMAKCCPRLYVIVRPHADFQIRWLFVLVGFVCCAHSFYSPWNKQDHFKFETQRSSARFNE